MGFVPSVRNSVEVLSGTNGEMESSTALAAPCQSVGTRIITDRERKGDQ
jgi:hypothetical protein